MVGSRTGLALLSERAVPNLGDRPGDAMTERLVGELKLAGITAAVPVARSWIRELLGANQPRIDDIELLVCEAASNAILHSESRRQGGAVKVALLVRGRVIRLEVTDDGSPCSSPHMVDTPCAETGRGMILIDALADAYGTRQAADGTATFWFEISVGCPAHDRSPGDRRA